jgi:tRNA A-37 threonylcarbamoyl transferase component Bud32
MQSALGTGHLVAGRYRLLDQVGRGAMGIVWRGRDELLDRDVAIKQIVLAPMASATEARASYERTLREARTAARLSHPGVVTVFDVVEEDGSPWIVMELVRARPLDQVIAEDGPLPPARAAQLGLGLLEALTSAHEAGVLHRDVKPSNVLISPDGKAVLTDFGIAMIQGDPGLTQAGMVVGTPGFSPPERVRGAPATRASDLWALGATLYAAVEGRGPFDRAGGSAAIIASIATEPAPRAPSAGPLAPVIDALLKPDPAERPDAATTARMLTQAWRTARTAGRVGVQASQLPTGQIGKAGAQPASARSEATTATQVVSVTDASPAGDTHQGELAAADTDANGSGSLIGAAMAVAPTAAAVSVVPDLMATPNFADLKMPAGTGQSEEAPDPAIEPAGALDLGGSGTNPPVAGGSGAGGEDARDNKAGDFLRKRGVIALAPVVALAIAAIVYAALPNMGTPLRRLGGGEPNQGPVAVARGGHHVKGTGRQGGHASGNRPGAGGSGPSGKPAPGKPSSPGKPSASGKPSSGKPSTSPSSSTSPTPSPDPTPSPSASSPGGGGVQPPTGYVWDRVTAASVGTIAGFRIAGPAAWVMTPGLNTVIKPTNGAARLEINMASWPVAGPVKEARRLQAVAKDKHKYPQYQLVSIVGTRFHGWPAARWTFWWQPAAAPNPTEVTELLFTVQTYDGPQQYVMRISAPSPRVAWALTKFHVAMRTFKALPFS